jgi:hypothetical protein
MNKKNLTSFLGKKRVSSIKDISMLNFDQDSTHDLNKYEHENLNHLINTTNDKNYDCTKEEKILNNLLNNKQSKSEEIVQKKKHIKSLNQKVENKKINVANKSENNCTKTYNEDDVEINLEEKSKPIHDSNKKSLLSNLGLSTEIIKAPESDFKPKPVDDWETDFMIDLDQELDEVLYPKNTETFDNLPKKIDNKKEIKKDHKETDTKVHTKNILPSESKPSTSNSNIIKIPLQPSILEINDKKPKNKEIKNLSISNIETEQIKSSNVLSQKKEEIKNVSNQKITKNNDLEKISDIKSKKEKLTSEIPHTKSLKENKIIDDDYEDCKNPIQINLGSVNNNTSQKDKKLIYNPDNSKNTKNPNNSFIPINNYLHTSTTNKNDKNEKTYIIDKNIKPQFTSDTGSYNSFLLKEEFARKLKHPRPISLDEFIFKVIEDLILVREFTLQKKKIYLVYKDTFWSKHLKCNAEEEENLQKILKDNWEVFMNPIHEDINYCNVTAKDLQKQEKPKEFEKQKERDNHRTKENENIQMNSVEERKTNENINGLNINFVSSSPWDNINFDDMTTQKRKIYESEEIRNRNFFIKSPSLKFATFD